MQVAVIGGGDSDPDTYMMARELGKRLAEKGTYCNLRGGTRRNNGSCLLWR
ncbi:MAG: hypothetical protein LUQ47_01410 [Methanotrichaceae archaeon]|nr:hypothetical protein [Methanotrichaceae archaeon]